MSQTQNKCLEFGIWTWGSCRRSFVEILYPTAINLSGVTARPGKHTVDLGFATIEYVNNDSRKNLDREVKIVDVKGPIILRHYGARSCNPKEAYDDVYLIAKNDGGEIVVKKLEVREKAVTEENGKYRTTYKVYYVVNPLNGGEIIVTKAEMSREPLMNKMKLVLAIAGGKVKVSGDTYHVKDTLKALGFRWNPLEKAWYADYSDDRVFELQTKLDELGVQVEVVMQ